MRSIYRNSKSIIAAMAIMTATLFSSCDSSEKKTDTSKSDLNNAEVEAAKAKELYNVEVAKFRMEATATIAANEKLIAEIREQKKDGSKEQRAEHQRQVDILKERNDNLKARMDNYEDNGSEKWKLFKEEFKHDMDQLGQAFKDLAVDNKK